MAFPSPIPIEARLNTPLGVTKKAEKTWRFKKEPTQGAELDVGERFIVVIADVKYADDSDGLAERAFADVDVRTYSHLLKNGWTEIE